MARRSFVAGNWKLNKTADEGRALALALRGKLEGFNKCDVAVCPTLIAIPAVVDTLKGTHIAVGGQNLFWENNGAYTGEISGPMLIAAGCKCVIVGHSERRQYFGETDATVNKRLKAGLASKLQVIVCVGETKDERVGHQTEAVVQKQIDGAFTGIQAGDFASIVVAYEPVWAIGTGLTATPQQAQDVHAFIRNRIKAQFGAGIADALRIQYGGSVKANNAKELLSQPDIDGALVGGASLVADEFEAIVKAAK